MDDRGYLITHPDLIGPNSRAPPEEKHITHKEPLIANDILNHCGFVEKKVCSSFGDRTVQRYYQVKHVPICQYLMSLGYTRHRLKMATRLTCSNPQSVSHNFQSGLSMCGAPCGLRGCKDGPTPFLGQMSYKATKPGLVSVLYLSMFFIVLVFIRAPFYVLLVFIVCVLSFGCSS